MSTIDNALPATQETGTQGHPEFAWKRVRELGFNDLGKFVAFSKDLENRASGVLKGITIGADQSIILHLSESDAIQGSFRFDVGQIRTNVMVMG